jgi:hypothetical protein
VIVVTCDWDCNKGINNLNGVISGAIVELGFRSDQVPPTLYNLNKFLPPIHSRDAKPTITVLARANSNLAGG